MLRELLSLSLPSLLLLLYGCEPVPEAWPPALEDLTLGIQSHFVPDRRVARLDVEGELGKDGRVYLRGETTLPDAKDSLLRAFSTLGYELVDSITVLPAASLGPRTYGLARHSVVNLRSERGHSQELATQVLLGTPFRILKQEEEWYLVQCPDGYLAWLNQGELVRKTVTEMDAWKAADRMILIGEQGFSYERADASATRIGDLVKGGILVRINTSGDYTEVEYPDGRRAFVATELLQPFTEWLEQRTPSFATTRSLAFKQLGKPYLWGGTSPKGMDCSGFTKTIYRQQGLIIPRDASQQVHAGEPVSYDDQLNGLTPGDFLFFGRLREDGSEKITHVGIYLGDGNFIHSGADNGANRIQQLLPDREGYAVHRRESLLNARRLEAGTDGVIMMKQHEWYVTEKAENE